MTCWKVVFYSAAHSRRRKPSMRVCYFDDLAAAEQFAANKTAYGRPARPDPVEPLTPEQVAVAFRAEGGIL